MGVRVLGRPALEGASGEIIEMRDVRQLGLLALLAAHRCRPVRTELLGEELWGSTPTGSAVRVTVRRLRDCFEATTGADPIISRPSGYTLELGDDEIDEARYGRLVSRAHRLRADGDLRRSVELIRQGEALWAGAAFEGIQDLPSVQPEHTRLENLRDDTREMLAASLIGLGDHTEAIGVLHAVLARDPYRESAWALQMLALYRAGRRHEALSTYEAARRTLAEQVGIDPGRTLSGLRTAMLDQKPIHEVGAELVAVRRRSTRGGPVVNPPPPQRTAYVDRRSAGRRRRGIFVGRADLLAEADRFVAGELGPSVLVVEGPAGIGKTSFGREVARAAGTAGFPVAWGTCSRVPATAPMVDHQLLSDVTQFATAASGEVDSVTAELDAVELGLEARIGARTQRYVAAERLLRSVPAPYVLVIDDAQWMSTDSAALISHVAGSLPGVRWLILARSSDRRAGFDDLIAGLARGRSMWRALGPLSDDEVSEIVSDQLPGATEEDRAVVVERSSGHPFLVVELIRHLTAGGDRATTPRTVDAAVGAEIRALGADAEALCSVVAVGASPLPVDVVLDAVPLDAARCETAIRALLASGHLRPDDSRSTVRLSHDLVREVVAARIDGLQARRIHSDLAAALSRRGTDHRPLQLTHLLAAGAVDATELDEVAAEALGWLVGRIAPNEAAELGEEYLATSGPRPRTRAGIQARLHLTTALFSIGDDARAKQLLKDMEPQISALDDPAVLAEVLMTGGPFTVDRAEADGLAEQGADLLGRLGSDDHRRRVRLACWVGQMFASAGRPAEANHAALIAEAGVGADPDVAVRAPVQLLRFRNSLVVDTDPEQANMLLDHLDHMADSSGDPTTEAAAGLARLDRCLRTSTIHEYAQALTDLQALPAVTHHGDLRWAAAAGGAALALARGDLESAAVSYLEALQVGTGLGVRTAFGCALLHRLLIDWEQGNLGSFRSLLPAEVEAGDLTVLAGRGLVNLEAGDLAGAWEVADLLARTDDVLVAAGATGWQLLASIGSLLAWRTEHRGLAANLGLHLRSHAGYGLSMNGLAYLGAADRAIGLVAATEGDLGSALVHLRRAHEDDSRRGAALWAARSARDLAVLFERRGAPDDLDEAGVLRMSADKLTRPGT